MTSSSDSKWQCDIPLLEKFSEKQKTNFSGSVSSAKLARELEYRQRDKRQKWELPNVSEVDYPSK